MIKMDLLAERQRLESREMKFFFGDGTFHVKRVGEPPVPLRMIAAAYVILVNGETAKDKATGTEMAGIVARAMARERRASAEVDELRILAMLEDPRPEGNRAMRMSDGTGWKWSRQSLAGAQETDRLFRRR